MSLWKQRQRENGCYWSYFRIVLLQCNVVWHVCVSSQEEIYCRICLEWLAACWLLWSRFFFLVFFILIFFSVYSFVLSSLHLIHATSSFFTLLFSFSFVCLHCSLFFPFSCSSPFLLFGVALSFSALSPIPALFLLRFLFSLLDLFPSPKFSLPGFPASHQLLLPFHLAKSPYFILCSLSSSPFMYLSFLSSFYLWLPLSHHFSLHPFPLHCHPLLLSSLSLLYEHLSPFCSPCVFVPSVLAYSAGSAPAMPIILTEEKEKE